VDAFSSRLQCAWWPWLNPPAPFQRNVTLCNHSTEKLDVAYAYDAIGTNEITSRGWRVVAPCSCRDLFSADVKTTEFFYYRRSPAVMAI
jgi:uncharacterized membrane protein